MAEAGKDFCSPGVKGSQPLLGWLQGTRQPGMMVWAGSTRYVWKSWTVWKGRSMKRNLYKNWAWLVWCKDAFTSGLLLIQDPFFQKRKRGFRRFHFWSQALWGRKKGGERERAKLQSVVKAVLGLPQAWCPPDLYESCMKSLTGFSTDFVHKVSWAALGSRSFSLSFQTLAGASSWCPELKNEASNAFTES